MAADNIVLVGFMGAGKSTVAAELAKATGYSLVDLDAEIEKSAGMTIQEIFRQRGEEAFRDLETLSLAELSGREQLVVATGGGILGRPGNRERIRSLGLVVYLRAPFPTLQERLSLSSSRPLVEKEPDWPALEGLFRSRSPLYESAGVMIDTNGKDPQEIAGEILQRRAEGEMAIETLQVGLGERSYALRIGAGILGEIGAELLAISFPKRIAIITNPLVGELYADILLASLRTAGFSPLRIDIPDGEEFKTLATVSSVYDSLMAAGFDRGCGIVALGGGVVGDLAGFVAATFLRGIPFAQIPTTLLAQVDSSVGGKTGVNHPLGKNLIGAFYQPRLVLIDVRTLATLSIRDYRAGFAEIVKYGVIRDREFFDQLVQEAPLLCAQEPATLVKIIRRSCQIKADIVERDEREEGVRAILNYGHTFGHALENLAGYGEYRHGEAVAIGMVVAAQISANLGLCQAQEVEAIIALLRAFGLPVIPPVLPAERLLEAMGRDKKVHSGLLRMILNRGIGDYEIRSVADPGALFSGLTSSLAL